MNTNTKTATRIEVIYDTTKNRCQTPGWYVRLRYRNSADAPYADCESTLYPEHCVDQPITARRNARLRALRPLVREVAKREGVTIPRGLVIEVHA